MVDCAENQNPQVAEATKPCQSSETALHSTKEKHKWSLHSTPRIENIARHIDTNRAVNGKYALPKLIYARCHQRCKKKKMLAKQALRFNGHLVSAQIRMPKITAPKPVQPEPTHAQKGGVPLKSFCMHSLRRPI